MERRPHRVSDFLARLFGSPRASSQDDARTPADTDREPTAPALPSGGPVPGVPETAHRGEESPELTAPLTLDRVENALTDSMDYSVRRMTQEGHSCLLGTWDSFPFVIEIPELHEGWLLVSGDWEEPAPPNQRNEIAASVNDWNRDKFFPTVAISDTSDGPLVRATYLMDLRAGVTDRQLRLHLDAGLASCIQALSQIGPLLPDL